MNDRGGEFGFFQDIHVWTDIRFDISIFSISKIDNQVHVE